MGHIYWVASYPKSGNTWMRAFLNQLVSPTPEQRGINRIAEIAPDENLGRFYQPFLRKPIGEASLEELAAVRPQVQQSIADAVPGFAFLKTHAAFGNHLGTPTIWPAATAGAIYILRNPLDVVVSYSRFRNWTVEETIEVLNASGRILPRAAEHSYVPCGSWDENVRSWTRRPHDRLLVVRYEDMVENPLPTFERVVRLLRLKVTKAEIERACRGTSFENLQREEQESGFVERPTVTERFFRKGVPNQWRHELTPQQVRTIARSNRGLMQRFGYWLDEFGA